MVRAGVYDDNRVQQYVAADETNKQKVDAILDEMCHLLSTQLCPARRIKFAGLFFIKCITRVYSSIHVNNHLLPLNDGLIQGRDLFKKQFLLISNELPIVILPTHRSYMDFLFISYIMTHYELPLPIVATGDNFKAMGKVITDYLKSTGAFLIRRNAANKRDIEATVYHDILRAYVHSVLTGGENPIEFFMEGTRTRVGQVLRPKTGLLSMVVDAVFDKVISDVYILPVAINYQRPIEEQLYIAENTPQINGKKPKESAKNLISAFDAVMKRQYGKVYVRFLKPFKLSEYFCEWKKVTHQTPADENVARNGILFEFTNSLASKVCLAQANNNILMPFNLLTCSILSRTFLNYEFRVREKVLRVPFEELIADFQSLEDLLRSTQDHFLPGWQSRLEIIDEFKLDRDGIIRASADHRYVEFNNDPLTFQTMLYYSNQTIQMLIPVAICSLLSEVPNKWEQYKIIRTLLGREFFFNESFMDHEFNDALVALNGNVLSENTRRIIIKHLGYFIRCYLKFLHYLSEHSELFDRNLFFQHKDNKDDVTEELYISKDMLKNMMCLMRDERICETLKADPGEQLKVIDLSKLNTLIAQYENVIKVINQREDGKVPKQ